MEKEILTPPTSVIPIICLSVPYLLPGSLLLGSLCGLSFPCPAPLFDRLFFCPGGFCLLVWVPLVYVCPILGGCVCSWTLTTFWMVRATPPARSSLPLG